MTDREQSKRVKAPTRNHRMLRMWWWMNAVAILALLAFALRGLLLF